LALTLGVGAIGPTLAAFAAAAPTGMCVPPAKPAAAIERAVNDTKDDDTVAAVVDAAVGALHGLDAPPPSWIDDLLGRTRADGEGRVEEPGCQALDRSCTPD